MSQTAHREPVPLDRSDPEASIAAAAARCPNWGRWRADDVLDTLNFGRPAGDVVTSDGDLVTGIQTAASQICGVRRAAGRRPGSRR